MAASPVSVDPSMASLLWNAPVILPDPGVEANITNPPTQMNTTILVITLEMAFLSISFLLRAYAKVFLNRKILSEDYFVTIASGLFAAQVAVGIVATQDGIGAHLWDLTVSKMSDILHLVNTVEIMYGLSMLFAKLAILCQFRRFFIRDRRRQPVMSWILYIFVALHTTFYIAHTVAFLAGCSPREGFWNPMIQAKCIDVYSLITASACINVISDFALLVLPIFHVWKLNASRQQKLGLTGVFTVGALGCGASIVRTTATYNFIMDRDKSYDLYLMGIWASVEVSCAILASNAPYIAQIYQTIRLKSQAPSRGASRNNPKDIEYSGASTRPSNDDAASPHYSVNEPEIEKPRSIYLPPHTRSVNLDGELPRGLDLTVSENYFEALFNPSTGPGDTTWRHELEHGLVPGTIVGAMRKRAEHFDRSERPRLAKPTMTVEESHGWFA